LSGTYSMDEGDASLYNFQIPKYNGLLLEGNLIMRGQQAHLGLRWLFAANQQLAIRLGYREMHPEFGGVDIFPYGLENILDPTELFQIHLLGNLVLLPQIDGDDYLRTVELQYTLRLNLE
ncbi:MAG: hypothetical protein KDK39_16025, partial [Leptospiraceae bacterium]|nr:hypothetical protein [Leptospiraceae bacterium]